MGANNDNSNSTTSRTSRWTRWTTISAATFFQALAIIGIAAAAGFIVHTAWEVFAGTELSDPVPVWFEADEVAIDLPVEVEIVEVEAQLTGPAGLGWRAVWGLANVIPAGLAIAALWILYRVLGDADDPFTIANVRRFQALAWIATGFLAVSAVRGPIELQLQDSLGLDVLDAELAFTPPLVIAILAWAFADIWRRGVALRAEQELTI
jgi:hypothetical protein